VCKVVPLCFYHCSGVSCFADFFPKEAGGGGVALLEKNRLSVATAVVAECICVC
jgi:hypothetical protein